MKRDFEDIDEMLKIRKNQKKRFMRKNKIKNSVLDYVRQKQLKLYNHTQRMNEEKLPQQFLE